MRIVPLVLLGGSVVCQAVEIASGTALQIRLTTPLSSASSKPGDRFSAVLIAPVVVGNTIALNAGAIIAGTVKDVTPASENARARLTPQFSDISDPAGYRAKLSAALTAVDNARESVRDGQIAGISANDTLSARLDQGLSKLTGRYADFAGILAATKGAAMPKTDADINYQPGVEMTITLTAPLDWTAHVEPLHLGDIGPVAALQGLVDSEPFRTVTDRTYNPSDITNIMFLGTEEQIREAFTTAGWNEASALNETSKLDTFRSMAAMQGYKEGPMSVLLLEGRPPDLALEKTNNTFEARHHLRIWRRPETFQGKSVWVCSSTHDTGIGFSEKDRTFIHKIDSDIDRERAKVVADLVFTGKVKALALVARDKVPTSASNGTGDPIATDGRMAVIEF